MNRSLLLLPMLVACGEGAGPEALLLAPDDVEVRWDSTFNEQVDGAVALVAVDVMVYSVGRREGEPVAGVPIQFAVAPGDAGFVLPEEVEWVDLDPCEDCRILWDMHMDRGFAFHDGSGGDGSSGDGSSGDGSSGDGSSGDGSSGDGSNGDGFSGDGFTGDESDVAAEIPAQRTVVTDEGGLARVYVFVDAFPLDAEGEPLPVEASLSAPSLMGAPSQRFSVLVR